MCKPIVAFVICFLVSIRDVTHLFSHFSVSHKVIPPHCPVLTYNVPSMRYLKQLHAKCSGLTLPSAPFKDTGMDFFRYPRLIFVFHSEQK